MSETVELWEKPKAEEIYMITGWRQWADAGSVSSGLPRYLIQQKNAHQIGRIKEDGFYLYQFPGTHDLVRPVVRFNEGYPVLLETPHNEIFYAGDSSRGLVILIGDEPHLNVERYVEAVLHIAQTLGVKRIIGLGGVYGELPYDKERMVSAIYSLPDIKEEMNRLAVNLSDYHGGASIGSYICRRASERDIEYVSFYAFVPAYDFSTIAEIGATGMGSSIRIENDFMAWLGVMHRVVYMLNLDLDLTDLEQKSDKLLKVLNDKVEELDNVADGFSVSEYMNRLSEEFSEMVFTPLDDVWEDELRRLFDKLDSGED